MEVGGNYNLQLQSKQKTFILRKKQGEKKNRNKI